MSEDMRATGPAGWLGGLQAVLVTAWAGSLWTVCFLVAPQLFATLPERAWAGQMAGRLFHLQTWLGVALALALIGVLAARRLLPARRGVLWIILLMAGAPLASELVLGPMMEQARAAGDMAAFGRLHGVSAIAFFSACLGGLALVWRLNRPAA